MYVICMSTNMYVRTCSRPIGSQKNEHADFLLLLTYTADVGLISLATSQVLELVYSFKHYYQYTIYTDGVRDA